MKKTKIILMSVLALTFVAFALHTVYANPGQNFWSQSQMMEPADLNKILKNPKASQPIVYCIGPQAVIKNSIDIGPTYDKNNLTKLKQKLGKLPKNANIVVYCGCCPFERCPNIRPVYKLLQEMGFTNHKLLNLPRNIKVDWIDKGYAVQG